jgi:hypothetical protein
MNKPQKFDDVDKNVMVTRYRKVEEMTPTAGLTRLYHLAEEKYYNWDGEKWVEETD